MIVNKHLDRKAKDTDYLLITEDMKTYGCGCCSIGLGVYNSIYSCNMEYVHMSFPICPSEPMSNRMDPNDNVRTHDHCWYDRNEKKWSLTINGKKS